MDRDDFHEVIVKANEDFLFTGPTNLKLFNKLKFFKEAIRSWIKKVKDKEGESEAILRHDLENLDKTMEERDLLEEEEWILEECKNVIHEIDMRRNKDLWQKSRVKWATFGDDNSRFFHSTINAHIASNRIHGLEINGSWIQKPSIIKKEVRNFFCNKFKESHPNRPTFTCPNIKKLSSEEGSFLVAAFDEIEIKKAVWDCGDEKAPGPDGFNFKFLKRFWESLGPDIIETVKHFHGSALLPHAAGSAFITLVPKSKVAASLNDYRPITLIGAVNKIISKLLANRLKKVLSSIISDTQSGFLSTGNIIDGPLMINEIIAWSKKKNSKLLLLKLDFEKAFDNINWNFLEETLKQMNFPMIFCNWIRSIISSARSSILVNGSPTFEFQCHKGVRQGDPLSPFLFIIGMEVLSCMISKLCLEGLFKGFQAPNNGPLISHMLYADDAIIVGEETLNNLFNIKRLLRCFQAISGLKINFSKSVLYGLNTPQDVIDNAASSIQCNIGTLPFTYLGLPVGANMNRIRNWSPILNAFDKRLTKWKEKSLSIGGRLTILKAVLEALPTYFFSLYKAPKKIIDILEAKRRNFFWSSNSETHKIAWVAWDQVTKPKEQGGLGISPLYDYNIALLTKWWWRYRNEEKSTWRRLIFSIHNINRASPILPYRKHLSGTWSSIAKLGKCLANSNIDLNHVIRGKIGSGVTIRFWIDSWAADKPFKELFPDLYAIESCKYIFVSECYLLQDQDTNWLWRWKREVLSGIELQQWEMCLGMLSSVRPSADADRWIWIKDKSKIFTVKSMRKVMQIGPSEELRARFKWCKWIPIKINIFGWRVARDRLPTNLALRARGMSLLSSTCPLCDYTEEDIDHLFTACEYANHVWSFISCWCKSPPIYAFNAIDLLTTNVLPLAAGSRKFVANVIILTAMWCIWNARNNLLFNNNRVSIPKLCRDIKSYSFLWIKNRSPFRNITWLDWCRFRL